MKIENTLAFSDEAAAVAKQKFANRLKEINFNPNSLTNIAVDPELWARAVQVGGNVIGRGYTKFADFSKQMISEFGESIKPELRKLFDKGIDAVYGSRRDLDLHELLGGHTIEKHVGKTEKWLRDRLEREPLLNETSTFYSREIANRAQSKVVQVYGKELDEWAKGNSTKPIKRTIDMDEPAGIVVVRARNATQTGAKVEAIIVKDNTERGWHILSAYPIPK